MRIGYEAYTWTGTRIRGVLETNSLEAAEEVVRAEQLVPYRLWQIRPRRSLVQLLPALFRPKDQVIIDFTRQLGTLVRSGIPLSAALRGLRDGIRDVGMREVLRQVMLDTDEGLSFSVACSRHRTAFPGFYVRLLRVAEATGQMSLILEQLARLVERRKTAKDRVRRALTYPAMALGVAGIAGFVAVTYSVPALSTLMGDFGGELPLPTQLLMSGTQFMKSYGGYGVWVILSIFLGWVLYGRTKRGQMLRDRVALGLPVIRKVVVLSNLFSLMSTFGSLLRGGVATAEALRVAGDEVGNTVMRQEMKKVAADVVDGQRMSQAFASAPLMPSLVVQAMRSGETAGTLFPVVEGLTDYYEKELDRSISLAVDMIQPAVTLVVAGVVGFVAVALLSGIYSTLGNVR